MLRRLCTFIALCVLAANASAGTSDGLSAAKSDSACSAHVPGYTLQDYVRECARLIDELKNIQNRCADIATQPVSAQARRDPQMFCNEFNLAQLNIQLTAALNDHAYFLIQCKGSGNYREALKSLDAALGSSGESDKSAKSSRYGNENYWLAIRNKGVAHMLLNEHDKAAAAFGSLLGKLNEVKEATKPNDARLGQVLVRPTSEADIRLGLGLALLGQCKLRAGSDELFETERLTMGPIVTDPALRAAALFGQGLVRKVKSAQTAYIARTNSALTPAERARMQRHADQLASEGKRQMDAAETLVKGTAEKVAVQYFIEERTLVTSCVTKPETV